jgi:hypothetical protein
VFFIHPWEVDPQQPRLDVSWLAGVRHYRGLERTLPRLEQLMRDFRFSSVARNAALQPLFGDEAALLAGAVSA